MLFERFKSEGLAHYSYLIADGGDAVVIDPRRDCDAYIEAAVAGGFRITKILETHRNEDYLIGSMELADRTGAQIWRADAQWDYRYGEAAQDGQTWRVGALELEAIHTPGHTPGMMSYLLRDPSGANWIVFTGDALFAGDVGRVDLMGEDRMEEMAGLLYDSLYERLLPLGDEVIVCPAHGSGSSCGAAIADREWTTIGLERRLNPRLRYEDKDEFVQGVARKLEYPPYFARMERLNLEGPPVLGRLPSPAPLAATEFDRRREGAQVLDTRSELAFSAAHVRGALSIWKQGVPKYAGWFLDYDRPILLVNETNDPSEMVRYLVRLGFDDVAGFLSGTPSHNAMLSWHMAGKESEAVRTVVVQEMCRILDRGEEAWILDVRSDAELASAGQIHGAHHIHLTQLPVHYQEVECDRPVYIFCGSGLRSMTAASLLKRKGWTDLAVVLGGFAGWISTTCAIE